MNEERAEVLLVASPGGHLLQMLALREAWEPHTRVWVTGNTNDARASLVGERVLIAHGPAQRSIGKLVRNIALAWTVLRRVQPSVVVSTGAAIAVPVVWIARLRRVYVIHVESLTRVHRLSLSGRLIAVVANEVYVQWPELQRSRRRVRYAGSVLSGR